MKTKNHFIKLDQRTYEKIQFLMRQDEYRTMAKYLRLLLRDRQRLIDSKNKF